MLLWTAVKKMLNKEKYILLSSVAQIKKHMSYNKANEKYCNRKLRKNNIKEIKSQRKIISGQH